MIDVFLDRIDRITGATKEHESTATGNTHLNFLDYQDRPIIYSHDKTRVKMRLTMFSLSASMRL